MGRISFVCQVIGLMMAAAFMAPWGCIDGGVPAVGPGCDGGGDGDGEDDGGVCPDPAGDPGTIIAAGGNLVANTGRAGDTDECVPATCAGLDLSAGTWSDGCGGVLDCGDWVSMSGGTFTMGDNASLGAAPAHPVSVPALSMWRTEVTVDEYAVCTNSGGCDEPATVLDDPLCVWADGGDAQRPVNCVTWTQAREFCEFAGGRLPSEAEWEMAARSGGADILYPWGDEAPDCSRAVMVEAGVGGCGMGAAWPVCSRPAGNTVDGFCDMAGNVIEWVEDDHHMGLANTGGYDVDGDGASDAPTDGSAWVDDPRGLYRTQRGGSYQNAAADLSTRYRNAYNTPEHWAPRIGFRCAKDPS